jgi:VCBS repeat-containing protein
MTVFGVNDAPTVIDDTYSASEDNTLSVTRTAGVLRNDQDPDGDALIATLVTGPTKGTLTFNADGSFTYQPNANFDGNDSFVYRAGDGGTQSAVATVTIAVSPVNDVPIAVNDLYSATQSAPLNVSAANGVLDNDTDIDSPDLTAALVRGPANGTLTLNADGSFTYTPAATFSGQDNFTYRASDNAGGVSNVATVTITSTSSNPWQNSRNRFDVNNDGSVSPIDVLVVVNDLNARGARSLPIPPVPPFTPPPFLDVNGDRSVSPQDALSVINHLNSGGTEGEGESNSDSLQVPAASVEYLLPSMGSEVLLIGEAFELNSLLKPSTSASSKEGTISRSNASNVPVTPVQGGSLELLSLQTDQNWDDLLAILADSSGSELADETDLALADLFGRD